MQKSLTMLLHNASVLFRLIVVSVAIAACSSIPEKAEKPALGEVPSGQSVVLGRIVYLQQDGTEKIWSSGLFPSDVLSLYVRRLPDGKVQRFDLKGDGSFAWPLATGEYAIVAWSDFPDRNTGRLWTTFSVPAPSEAVYVGDLRMAKSSSRFVFAIEDQAEQTFSKYAPEILRAQLQSRKSLMRPEPKLGSYKEVWGICAERWGLQCNREYLGVEPTSPEGARTGYPSVSNLQPLLEWKPSSKAGVKYDVAIYESLPVGLDIPGAPRIKGALVAYAEGLTEPRFQVDTPLPASTKFDWSVRLRDGETVSTWTLSSYFAFFIVGWASGTGMWFGLATP